MFLSSVWQEGFQEVAISLNTFYLIFEEAAEKIIRIEFFLKAIKSISTEEERRLINLYEKDIDQLKRDLHQSIQVFFKIHSLENELDVELLENILSGYFSICGSTIGIQQELDSFVSFPKLPPEIYTTVRSLFSYDQQKRLNPIILYISRYVTSHIKKRIEPMENILFLPYMDFSNPVMWAYLFHEMGHAILAQEEEGGIPKLVNNVQKCSHGDKLIDWIRILK